jgi:hypothetical protein
MHRWTLWTSNYTAADDEIHESKGDDSQRDEYQNAAASFSYNQGVLDFATKARAAVASDPS